MADFRVIVVGAGVTGLTAAHRMAADRRVEVVVLEASPDIGGQLHAVPVPGTDAVVDVGAESVHRGRGSALTALVTELGLDQGAVTARSGASLLQNRQGRLVPLPAGVGPAGPTRLGPVAASGLLSPQGMLRARLEPLFTRRRFTGPISVGAFLTYRFGNEVVEVLVDPVLGNLHAGNVHGLGVQEVAPTLAEAARDGRSLLSRRRGPAPQFTTWTTGTSELTRTLASGLDVRTGSAVVELESTRDGWTMLLASGSELDADHVLVTTPGPVMIDLLGDHSNALKSALEWVRTASVATVVMGFEPAAVRGNRALTSHNGVLLGHGQATTFKAATHLSRKWKHLADLPLHLVRASVGRSTHSLPDTMSDAELIDRTVTEYTSLIGLDARPEWTFVQRWPATMPQLAAGHLGRIAAARAELAEIGGLSVAGAFVDGLGVTASVRSGEQAAAAIIADLDG